MARRRKRSSVDSTTLDRFGRVLLPKPVRDRLGLRPGDALDLSVESGSLVLRPRPAVGPGIVVKRGLPVLTGFALEGGGDVVEMRRRIREEMHRRKAGLDRA